jgi:hypothetical protein
MHQNQVGFNLSVTPQNRRMEVDTGHALRSSDLLYVKASQGKIFQPGLKTGEGVNAAGVRDIIVEIVWS